MIAGGLRNPSEGEMRRIEWLGVLLVLAACTQGGARHWTKAGVTQETTDHDYAECESQAREATRREAGIDADILATRGHDWQRTGTLGRQEANMAEQRRVSAANIISQCMAAKGYLRSG